MPRKPLVLHLERDDQIYHALNLIPMTPGQICKLSQIWDQPFNDVKRARERLATLASAGRLRSFRYATRSRGEQSYYVMTRSRYHLLHGRDAQPPRNAFRELSFTRQQHTRILADILVHALILAHRDGAQLQRFRRENEKRYQTAAGDFQDDGYLELLSPGGRPHVFHLECDRSTRPLSNQWQQNSLQSMVQKYEALADESEHRFRVLFITTGSPQHVRDFLQIASKEARYPGRMLCYGITLEGFLQLRSLREKHLLNHHLQMSALISEKGSLVIPKSI